MNHTCLDCAEHVHRVTQCASEGVLPFLGCQPSQSFCYSFQSLNCLMLFYKLHYCFAHHLGWEGPCIAVISNNWVITIDNDVTFCGVFENDYFHLCVHSYRALFLAAFIKCDDDWEFLVEWGCNGFPFFAQVNIAVFVYLRNGIFGLSQSGFDYLRPVSFHSV